MKDLKEVHTSKVSGKTLFLKYDIIALSIEICETVNT